VDTNQIEVFMRAAEQINDHYQKRQKDIIDSNNDFVVKTSKFLDDRTKENITFLNIIDRLDRIESEIKDLRLKNQESD
tara:strand:+ start:737 stop:970 length:234 start_codon:yes stop_codon:yes gene_type:complete